MPTIKEMFKSGVHFGHLKERTDARSKPYLFGLRDKIYLINLEKTQECLEKASDFLAKKVKEDALFLWVATKYQAKDLVSKTAEELGQPYVTERWLGGTLTNFEKISSALQKMKKLKEMVESEGRDLGAKEKSTELKKLRRLEANFKGLQKLSRLPDVLLVVDAKTESIAVKEANTLGIPIVAITDVDSNPRLLDYPIFVNDDSVQSLTLILNVLKEALSKGKGLRVKGKAKRGKGAKQVKS